MCTLYKYGYTIICMAMVEVQDLLSLVAIYVAIYDGWMQLALQGLIIVQTIIQHRSKVFTSGQARVNPEPYVIKCMGGW